MSTNFHRTYSVKAGPAGGSGIELGTLNSSTQEALRINFDIEKADSESPNTAKVQIYNLANKSISLLEQKDCHVELKAGYDNVNALILSGDVTNVNVTREDANTVTEIEVADGMIALRDTTISVSIKGPADSKTVFQKIAGEMGTTIQFADGLTFKKLAAGFSFVGKAKTALQDVAQANGLTWTIQNDIIQVTKPGQPVSEAAFVLSKDTGLIEVPTKITESESSTNTKKKEPQTGWEVKYLLNGAIGVNSVVILQSRNVSGSFRVKKVKMTGDNYEGDWICTAEVYAM